MVLLLKKICQNCHFKSSLLHTRAPVEVRSVQPFLVTLTCNSRGRFVYAIILSMLISFKDKVIHFMGSRPGEIWTFTLVDKLYLV
jgi:hypothetical protein